MLTVFENDILPIYNTSHVQYVIYYFLSFKPALAENFKNWLWKKCCDVSSLSTLRQAAAGYLASFVCRSPFLSNRYQIILTLMSMNNIGKYFICTCIYFFRILKDTIFEISLWCNNYISRVDKSVTVVTEDLLRWHAVFYSMCQALFYIISFRHQDLMDGKKSKLLHDFMMNCI